LKKIDNYVKQMGSTSKPFCVYLCNLLDRMRDKECVKKYLSSSNTWKLLFEKTIIPLSEQYYPLSDMKEFVGTRSIFSFMG